MKTGIFWDNHCTLHEIERGHAESPHRLFAIKQVIDTKPDLISISPRKALTQELLRIHTPRLVNSVLESKGKTRTYFDPDTQSNEHSADAALLSAGSTIDLVDKVQKGELDNGFSFPRPPGHHAEYDRIMGFCFFNNIAIACEHLIKVHKLKRIAIVDYDVHHGNGTQASFYDRNDVLFASIHRYPFYPGTGALHEEGAGRGLGFTINAPLPGYSNDAEHIKAFNNRIIPKVDDFKPEFILVSAGFDSHERDPLGGMLMTKKGFDHFNKELVKLANKHCDGKIVFVLEGGYDMKALIEGVSSVFAALT